MFGRHFLQFALPCTLILLPALALSLFNVQLHFSLQLVANPRLNGVLFSYLFSVPYLLLRAIAMAVVVRAAFMVLRGEPVRIGQSLREGLGRSFPVIGLVTLQHLGIFTGFILLVVPGVILMTILYVALSACVLERQGAIASFKRSASLTKGYRWKVFAILVILTIAGGAVELAFVRFGRPSLGATGFVIADFPLDLIVTVFNAVIGVTVYHDLRAAKEGLGVETIAAVFD